MALGHSRAVKMEIRGDTLCVTAVKELGTANHAAFRDWVRKGLVDGLKSIEIDLSETTFLDSCGLGALVALQQAANRRQGEVRLLHPQPPIQQILELTRMQQLFDIVKS
jgi:anti-sigma B factor antagonist